MVRLLQSKTVLVYDSSHGYLGAVRASALKAEAISGLIDDDDLIEAMNLIRRPKTRGLTVYDRLTGFPVRFYRVGSYQRVVIDS